MDENVLMENFKNEFASLQKEFGYMKKTLADIHGAIVGNPLSKDGGMQSRLAVLEVIQDEHEKKLLEFEKKQIGFNMRTGIMWAALGAVAMAIFMYLLNSASESKRIEAVIPDKKQTYIQTESEYLLN